MSRAVQLTTPQAARQYDVPLRTLQHAIRTGELKAVELDVRGKTYVVSPKDVEVFAQAWRARRARRVNGSGVNGSESPMT